MHYHPSYSPIYFSLSSIFSKVKINMNVVKLMLGNYNLYFEEISELLKKKKRKICKYFLMFRIDCSD